MARFGFILDLGGGDGGLLFHFILSKIVTTSKKEGATLFFPTEHFLTHPPHIPV